MANQLPSTFLQSRFLGQARLRVESALWSHICVVVVVDPPPGWLTPPHVMDGWGARPLR